MAEPCLLRDRSVGHGGELAVTHGLAAADQNRGSCSLREGGTARCTSCQLHRVEPTCEIAHGWLAGVQLYLHPCPLSPAPWAAHMAAFVLARAP